MEAMPEDEEPRTPIGEFIRPLGLDQYRATMRQHNCDQAIPETLVHTYIAPPGAAPGAAHVWAMPEVRVTWKLHNKKGVPY